MVNARQVSGSRSWTGIWAGACCRGRSRSWPVPRGSARRSSACSWADAGCRSRKARGVICDLTSRGDSQNHRVCTHAVRLGAQPYPLMPDTVVRATSGTGPGRSATISTRSTGRAGESAGPTSNPKPGMNGRPSWRRILRCSVGFFYQHFARGVRRVVFDGLEPTERFSESIQFEFFEYIYHHVLRKDSDWAAREWFREQFRANAHEVARHPYDHRQIGCVYLYTTPHVMLEDLLAQPIGSGDIFSNANTIILMGRTRHDGRMGRALAIAKHRGSAHGDEILPFRITEAGLVFD